jgi:hypothetical protein
VLNIADRIVVFRYRCYGTTYRTRLQGSKIQEAKDFFEFLITDDSIDMLAGNDSKN